MEKINLGPDEGVILRAENVACRSGGNLHELILTNKNLVFVKKGLFGRVKEVLYFPLADVKIVNGKAQALVGRGSNGQARLEVYLRSGEEEFFTFNTGLRREAVRWAAAVAQQLGTEGPAGADPSETILAGAETVARTLKGAVDTFRTAFGMNEAEKTAAVCRHCGASYEASKGRVGKCPYCGSLQNN